MYIHLVFDMWSFINYYSHYCDNCHSSVLICLNFINNVNSLGHQESFGGLAWKKHPSYTMVSWSLPSRLPVVTPSRGELSAVPLHSITPWLLTVRLTQQFKFHHTLWLQSMWFSAFVCEGRAWWKGVELSSFILKARIQCLKLKQTNKHKIYTSDMTSRDLITV